MDFQEVAMVTKGATLDETAKNLQDAASLRLEGEEDQRRASTRDRRSRAVESSRRPSSMRLSKRRAAQIPRPFLTPSQASAAPRAKIEVIIPLTAPLMDHSGNVFVWSFSDCPGMSSYVTFVVRAGLAADRLVAEAFSDASGGSSERYAP